MIIKSSFIDLEKARLESLQHKIQEAINDMDENSGKQWVPLRCERPLLETLLRVVEKEMENETFNQKANLQSERS